MTSNDDVTAEIVHATHRMRFSGVTDFDEICMLCGATDNPLRMGDGGRLGRLVYPCSASDEARRQYDARAIQRKALSQDRVLVELGFAEVKEEMFPVFFEQVDKCSSTLLDLGLIVHVFGRRVYAGGVRYAIEVSVPKLRADSATLASIRRWFEDGTW